MPLSVHGSVCFLPQNIYQSVLLQQAVSKVGLALNEKCSGTTAGSQSYCILCTLITCRWHIYIFATLLLKILKHNSIPEAAHTYLALFLSNSSCLLISASILSCIKRKYGHHLTHAEGMTAEKLALIKLSGRMAGMGCDEMNGGNQMGQHTGSGKILTAIYQK